MKSGGFGIGKKQAQRDEPKRLPPTNADLTSLLAQSQKAQDKPFTLSWHAPSGDGSHYVLSVVNFGSQKDRRGWNSSAIDNSGVGIAEWKLHRDIEGRRTELFNMQTSDAFLIQSVIEEALTQGAAPGRNEPLGSSNFPAPEAPASQAQSGSASTAQSGTGSQSTAAAPASSSFHEGNLRQISPRKLMEHFNTNKDTGRLICDIGTVTAEVFFKDGEPVHAKSCHSIYGNKDNVGDEVVVDLLTWQEGDFKFQDKWPAATSSVTKTLQEFLSGTAGGAAAGASSGGGHPAPAIPASSGGTAGSTASQDDFSKADDLIGDVYANMIEKSGLLKYGMFLMLARTEFARFEIGKDPFCVAAIGLESDRALSDAAIGKIGECFEPVGQPLDILAYASRTRLYALFPHSSGASAGSSLKLFLNNIQSTPLEGDLHGSAVKVTIGLCEVPRDGVDFQQIFENACMLRRAATPEKRIVASAG